MEFPIPAEYIDTNLGQSHCKLIKYLSANNQHRVWCIVHKNAFFLSWDRSL